jgi:hypothetical protein
MSTKDTKRSKNKVRSDWEDNQETIREAYVSILKRKRGGRPKSSEISKETGLSRATILRHMKTLDVSCLAPESNSFKILTDDVMISIFRSAMKGSAASQKLWLQVVEGWSEKQINEHTGRIETTPPAPPVILKITGPEIKKSNS